MLTHGDSIDKIGDNFKIVGRSSSNIVAAISNDKSRLYGVQFHPEVDLTTNGKTVLNNFLTGVCGLACLYNLQDRMTRAMNLITDQVNLIEDAKVLMLLSGGVDSTVCTALLHKALGPDRVIAVHIDNGFMRKNESTSVEASLAKVGLKVIVINANMEFMNGHTVVEDKKTPLLCHVIDPETKRKIIGDTFMTVANRIIEDMKLDPDKVILGQGTLRPDLIESASSEATVGGAEASCIKTHHNDTALVRQLRQAGKVVEPLKDFHKDEVRQLGKQLGLSSELIERHPFPGPGLAIRVLCSNGEIQVRMVFFCEENHIIVRI